MTTFSQLLNSSLQIKDETIDEANSAQRVGGLFEALVRALVLPYDPDRDYVTNQYCVFNDALYRALQACAPGESPTAAPTKWKTGDGTLQLVTNRGAVTDKTIDVGGLQSVFEVVESADGVVVGTAISPDSPKKKQKFATLEAFGKMIQSYLDWSKVTVERFYIEEGVIRLEFEDDTLPVLEIDLSQEFIRKTDADEYLSEKFDDLAGDIDLAYVLENGNNSVGGEEPVSKRRGAIFTGAISVLDIIHGGLAELPRADGIIGVDFTTNRFGIVTPQQAAEYIDPEVEPTPLPDNQNPNKPTYSTIEATAGQYFAVDLENFTDPEGGQITYSLRSSLPAGTSFNLQTLEIKGTIPVAGTYSFTFRGTDPRGGYTDATISVVAAEPVGILNMSEPTYNGSTGALKINATSTDTSTPVEYRINGLRDWGTSPNFTVPEWQRSGVSFLLEARQGSRTASRNFTTPVQANRPPRVVTAIPAQTLTVNQAFSLQVPLDSFIDDDSDPLAYSSTNNPPGTFSWSGRVLSGTPTQAGTYQVAINVTDGKGGSATQVVTFVVNAASSNLQLTEPAYNATTGALTANISGGDGTQIQYSIPDISAPYQNSANFTIPGAKRGTTITIYAKQSGVTVSRAFAVPAVNPITNLQGRFYYDGFLRTTIKGQFNGLAGGSTPQLGIYYPTISPAGQIAWVNMTTTSESGFTHTVDNFVGTAGTGYGGNIQYFIRAGVGQQIYKVYDRDPTGTADTGFIALSLVAHDGNVSGTPTVITSANSSVFNPVINWVDGGDGQKWARITNSANPTIPNGQQLIVRVDGKPVSGFGNETTFPQNTGVNIAVFIAAGPFPETTPYSAKSTAFVPIGNYSGSVSDF